MSLSIGLLGFERSFDILFRACESTTENDALCTYYTFIHVTVEKMTDHSTCNSADLKVPTYLHYKNISDGLFGGYVSVNQITR